MKKKEPLLRFSSLLLKRFPEVRKWGRPEKVISRIFFGVTLIGLFVVLVVLTRSEIFPEEGIMYVLYWIHDVVYLGLKGFTWTLFFPWSLIWYTILAGVILMTSVSFLGDRSLLLTPHILALHLMVELPFLHPIVVKSTRLLMKAGITSVLLRTFLEKERMQLIYQIYRTMDVRDRIAGCKLLAQVTALLIQIECLFYQPNYMDLAVRWEEAFVTVKFSLSPAEKKEEAALQHIQKRMMPSFFSLISFLGKQKSDWLDTDPLHQQAVFGVHALFCDLIRLVSFGMEEDQKSTLQDKLFDDHLATPEHTVLTARSVDQRRFFLEDAVESIQIAANQVLATESLISVNGKKKRPEFILRNPSKPVELESMYQFLIGSEAESFEISVLIAFHLALLDHSYERAIAYFEALDSFSFSVNSMDPLLRMKDSAVEQYRPPLPQNFPPPLLQTMAAYCQGGMQNNIIKKMEFMKQVQQEILNEKDIHLFQQRTMHYRLAAGPIVSDEVSDQNGRSK